MAFQKSFERELYRLFDERTEWLRRKLGQKRVGKPPTFNRKKVNRGIAKLQDLASEAFAKKMAKTEFESYVAKRKNYQIKGRGVQTKKEQFEAWFHNQFSDRKGIVYAFWNSHRQCVYVGRTGSHGCRPSAHFEKYWFSHVTRVTIYSVKGKSQVPKLECLAIHHFQPKQNSYKASAGKYTKACPMCKMHSHIKSELRAIFRLR